MTRRARIVGLTGGVASGKSTVAARFAALGAHVIDVDDISRALTSVDGSATPQIQKKFPSAFEGGALNRTKLRELVFADATHRHALEAILHPMIRNETTRLLNTEAANAAPYVLLVVPLMFEGDAYLDVIDCAIVVDVPRATQLERLVKTRGLSPTVAEQIVNAQFSREERVSRAQFVIDNTGSLVGTEAQVDRLHAVFSSTYGMRISADTLSASSVEAAA
jgi:dephospho-CoA kinase